MTPVLIAVLLLQAEPAPGKGAGTSADKPARPVRVYTNDDLERMRPFRHETGVASVPAVSPGDVAAPARPAARPGTRGEEYWRREAARVRERVAGFAAQAEAVRATLEEREEERRRAVGRTRTTGASDRTLRTRLAGLERRMRQLEDDLRDRARREGALPGWLR